MLAEEVLVNRVVLYNVVSDVVEDHQVRLWRKHHPVVRQLKATVLEGGQHGDVNIRIGETTVGDARPEDRVHFRHVGAPQNKRIGMLDIVVAAHRFVHAKGTHKAYHR